VATDGAHFDSLSYPFFARSPSRPFGPGSTRAAAIIAASKYIRLAEDGSDEEGAVRRLVGRVNPRNPKGVRLGLSMSVQCVLPGEHAYTHRHSAAATDDSSELPSCGVKQKP